jgi:3-dehydroquinate synthetase
MCGEAIRPRVITVLKKCGLYRRPSYDWDDIAKAAFHDKKADGNTVTVAVVNEIGKYELQAMHCFDVIEQAKTILEGVEA